MFRFLSCARQAYVTVRFIGRQDGYVKRFGILAVPVFIGVLCCPALSAQAPLFVITHVTVIETRGGSPQQDMTVSIRGDRIMAITKSTAASSTGRRTSALSTSER
jgi:hypothetical protein